MIKINGCCPSIGGQIFLAPPFATQNRCPGDSFNFFAAEPTIYAKTAENGNKREIAF